jgi:short-subunit dehydrogenase
MSKLESTHVLITGAAGGFGQELTRQLLMKGSRLILVDHPEVELQAKIEKLKQTLEAPSGEVLAYIKADLAHREGCDFLLNETQRLGLPVDILINNAGVAVVGSMVDIPQEQWEHLMEVNLMTPMRLSTRFAADMAARRQGHIVNMASLAGWIAMPGLAAYATSKYGLRGFSESLRHELFPYNVKVTAVYPFFSRTPILQSPRYGSLAAEDRSVAPPLTTDPARVMARTIRAIECDQTEVFPDAFAWGGHLLKRYLPLLPDLISRRQGIDVR